MHVDAHRTGSIVAPGAGRVLPGIIFKVAAGAYAIKPRGVAHTHWNATQHPARVMEITTPGAFETFFDELGALFAAGGPPDPAALNELGERHATRFLMDWVPELTESYGVRLLGT